MLEMDAFRGGGTKCWFKGEGCKEWRMASKALLTDWL